MQRGGHSRGRVLEVDREMCRDVDATTRTHTTVCRSPSTASTAATAAKHVAEQIAEAARVAEVADVEIEPTGSARSAWRPHAADFVVLGACVLIAENVVCRGDILEPLLGGVVTWVLILARLIAWLE